MPIGIANHFNNCFLNVVLQTILYFPLLENLPLPHSIRAFLAIYRLDQTLGASVTTGSSQNVRVSLSNNLPISASPCVSEDATEVFELTTGQPVTRVTPPRQEEPVSLNAIVHESTGSAPYWFCHINRRDTATPRERINTPISLPANYAGRALKAFWVHFGHATDGHYVALFKLPDGSWVEANDSSVTLCTPERYRQCEHNAAFAVYTRSD